MISNSSLKPKLFTKYYALFCEIFVLLEKADKNTGTGGLAPDWREVVKNPQLTEYHIKYTPNIHTSRYQETEKIPERVAQADRGHLQRAEKILAFRSPEGRDRRRATRPESEERWIGNA